MAGLLVPVVFLPRFTGLIGSTGFYTLPIDVAAYYELRLSLWRGPIVGTGTNFGVTASESIDREHWSAIAGGSNLDPGTDDEEEYVLALSKRWLRLLVQVGGTNPGTTCWAAGYLVKRVR